MKYSIGILLILFFSSLHGQEIIKEKAQAYADAYVNSSFLEVAEMTHPSLVEMSGGSEYVIEDLKAERNITTEQGLVYTKAVVGEPAKIIAHEGELQAVVPVVYHMQQQDKEYTNASSILAVSKDEGKTYSFVNLLQHDKESINFFIKNLSPEIEFSNPSSFDTIEK